MVTIVLLLLFFPYGNYCFVVVIFSVVCDVDGVVSGALSQRVAYLAVIQLSFKGFRVSCGL